METIGSKRSYALIWCMPNNDDDDVTGKASDLYMFCPNSSQNFPYVEWLK